MKPAQFIADLYELKSKLIQPVDYRQIYAEPNITYAVIQTLIATFSDKYKVDPRDVMDELRKRDNQSELDQSPTIVGKNKELTD